MTEKKEENTSAEKDADEESSVPCCSEKVHIAYRGKADDKLYIAYNRNWSEIRYYQANGLKAFCATCRHRVY